MTLYSLAVLVCLTIAFGHVFSGGFNSVAAIAGSVLFIWITSLLIKEVKKGCLDKIEINTNGFTISRFKKLMFVPWSKVIGLRMLKVRSDKDYEIIVLEISQGMDKQTSSFQVEYRKKVLQEIKKYYNQDGACE